MNILSATFHVENQALQKWDAFVQNELPRHFEKLLKNNQFIFAEIETYFIEEGKNFSLLLTFDSEEARENFIGEEIQNLKIILDTEFEKEEVFLFTTKLNPLIDGKMLSNSLLG